MIFIASDAAGAAHLLNDEAHASSLWIFVHLMTPRFASPNAFQVVSELAPQLPEYVKFLAKRLSVALVKRGVLCMQNPHPGKRAEYLLNSELAPLLEDSHDQPATPIQLDGMVWVSPGTCKRYCWHLTTLRITGGDVPQVVTQEITLDESARLLRSRNMVVHNGRFLVPEDTVQHLQMFDSERPNVQVDRACNQPPLALSTRGT